MCMWGYGPFSWHHDVNVEVNKLKLNIQRTVVVKISKGKSYREIAGYKVWNTMMLLAHGFRSEVQRFTKVGYSSKGMISLSWSSSLACEMILSERRYCGGTDT